MPIRDETGADHAAVARVHRLAFGGDAEARLVEALRRSGAAAASLVAECGGGTIVGHVLLSRLVSPPGALALAPLAVLPDRQRRGVGSALVRAALARARAGGWAAAFVLGNPAFYGRFGFEAEAARGYASPYAGEHFMVAPLGAEPLPGVGAVVHPEPFAALG
jgi:putative acetyltransferase